MIDPKVIAVHARTAELFKTTRELRAAVANVGNYHSRRAQVEQDHQSRLRSITQEYRDSSRACSDARDRAERVYRDARQAARDARTQAEDQERARYAADREAVDRLTPAGLKRLERALGDAIRELHALGYSCSPAGELLAIPK